jgi:hypothetical protein
MKTFKKGDELKIQLKNNKVFHLIFVDYHSIKGVAWGKFKNEYGEFQYKPFNIDSIV